MSSLAQDELGHAAALYALLGGLTDTDPDALAYDRAPDAYRHCRLLDHGRGDWAMTIARRFLYDTADVVRLEALAGGSWAPLAELVGKLLREERYHRMHAGAWLDRLARSRGEARDRLLAALGTLAPDAATVFTPLPGGVGTHRRRAPRGTDARAGGSLASVDRSDLRRSRPADAAARERPGAGPARPRRGLPLAVGRVHLRPPGGPGSGLVSEAGTQVGIARVRAGAIAGSPAVRIDASHDPCRPSRGDGSGASDGLDRRPRDDRRDLGRSCDRRGLGRAAADLRRLPGARPHPGIASPTGSRPSRSRSISRRRSGSHGRRTGSRPRAGVRWSPPGSRDRRRTTRSAARIADRPGWSWTPRSARRNAGRCTTAATAASHSRR